MLLPAPLLLGFLGLVAAEPAIYFKEQFLDGGKRLVSPRGRAGDSSAPLPTSALLPVIIAQRANMVAPGD